MPHEPVEATTEPDVDDGPLRSGPVRRCALTRLEMPTADMMRFVAGPDGVVAADVARRLPGRGVWVDLNRAAIEKAVTRNVFAKSLKRPVTAMRDLPDQVAGLLHTRVVNALSLATKAGLVVTGFTKVAEAIDGTEVAALFHGRDAATDGCDKLDRKFRAVNEQAGRTTVVVTQLTIDQISLAIGRSNVVHAALIPGGATTRLLDDVRRLQRFQVGPDASPTAFDA